MALKMGKWGEITLLTGAPCPSTDNWFLGPPCSKQKTIPQVIQAYSSRLKASETSRKKKQTFFSGHVLVTFPTFELIILKPKLNPNGAPAVLI